MKGPKASSRNQTAVIAAGRIVAACLSAAWMIVAARTLTLDQFSDLALVLALGSAIFFLTDAGYTNLLAAHVARLGVIQGGALRLTVRYRLAGSAIAMVVLTAGYLMAANDRSLLVPALFAGSLVGNAVHGSVAAALRSVRKSGAEAWNEVISRVVLLVAGWAWLSHGGGVAASVFLYSAVDLLSGVAMWILAMRWIRQHPAAPEPRLDLHWRRSMPIAVGAGLATVYGRIDTWLVALLAAPGASGLYAAAYRITDAIRIPASAAGAVTLADAGRAGDEGASLARRRSVGYMALAVVAAALLLILAEPIMRFLFGEPYGAAAPTLRVLALASIASSLVSILSPTAAVWAGARYPVAVGVVLGVNLLVNLVLIPRYGSVGAAWADVVSEVALAGLLMLVLSRPHSLTKT